MNDIYAIAVSDLNEGIWYSKNSGETWSQSNITSGQFKTVFMYGTNAIAGSDDGLGILYSQDSGKNWSQSYVNKNK
jgi:photosystem II stability/assembly factor-like uncharacterized protein